MDINSLLGIGGTTTTPTNTTTTTTAPTTTDIVGAVTQGMAMLSSFFPDGGLKNFLANPIGTITHALTSLAGRTYTTGNYRLGERFMRHILNQDPGGYRTVPDEVVPAAQQFFTMALGVDIWNDEDLQALYGGVEAYFARPDKQDVPRAAAVRAVKVMSEWPMTNPQNPNAWYIPWPLEVLRKYPSDPSTMGYYSTIVNKNLPMPAPTGSGGIGAALAQGGGKIFLWLGVLALVVVAIILIAKRSKK